MSRVGVGSITNSSLNGVNQLLSGYDQPTPRLSVNLVLELGLLLHIEQGSELLLLCNCINIIG